MTGGTVTPRRKKSDAAREITHGEPLASSLKMRSPRRLAKRETIIGIARPAITAAQMRQSPLPDKFSRALPNASVSSIAYTTKASMKPTVIVKMLVAKEKAKVFASGAAVRLFSQ